ncbi:hypothetical protein [Sphingobium sp.]|uniref:hypothetical protein n=1 Tax=Sphingobium sp. TaxID=1912891 RepID=UPI003B3A60F5
MDVQRKATGRSATTREGSHAPIVTVTLPEPYEGIGNALRTTYMPGGDGVPDDMMALLAKLDRH